MDAPARAGSQVVVDGARCGTPSTGLRAGRVRLYVSNRSRVFVTVYVTDQTNTSTYAETPRLAPNLSLPLTTTLAAGRYVLRCVYSDGVVQTSSTLAVEGTTTGAVSGYRPLPAVKLDAPGRAYHAVVAARLPGLQAACRALEDDVTRGDRDAARSDWLTAHLDYERLGAAYSAFGGFDNAINGRADGLPQGVVTHGWTGLHAIEYNLWHGHSAVRLKGLTSQLVKDVDNLVEEFPEQDIGFDSLALRAHEILEDSVQFQLTGAADYGSGSVLATVYAHTEGTRDVLSVLAPLLRPSNTALLDRVQQGLAQVQADLGPLHGRWRPIALLSVAQRQRLDGHLGQLLEELSAIPNLLALRTAA